MPITITNNTDSPVSLAEIGIEEVGASQSIDFGIAEQILWTIRHSSQIKEAVASGDITVSIDNTEGFDLDQLCLPESGEAIKAHIPSSISSMSAPANPSDGDKIFHPAYRLRFYWDGVRSKWLTDFVFDMFFTFSGQISVDDYLGLVGIPNAGFQLPIPGTVVTWNMAVGTPGTEDTVFSLEKNGVEVQTFTAPATKTFSTNLSISWDIDLVTDTDVGYRYKVKSCTGTPPSDIVMNMAYRLRLA